MTTRRHFGAAGLGAVALALSGRPLRAEPAPLRVISAGGALTEIVFRLDAQALLVGTDTTSIYPAAAASLPKVGYLRQLSAESVLSLKPTLLLTASEAGPPTAMQQLRSASVQIVQGDGRHSIEALSANVRLLGDALRRAERGHVLDADLQREWAATQAAFMRRNQAPRVLFVLSHAANQVQVSGTGTAADAMIRYAGGVNAMSAFSGYKPLAAFGGALAFTALVYRIGAARGALALPLVLLAGIALNALAMAGVGFLSYLATDEQLRNLTFWTFGSLSGATWASVGAVTPLVLVALALGLARPLNALALGETQAGHLGVEVVRIKRFAIVLTALAVGSLVALTGVIGFVGLVAPHAVRLACGPDHRVVLPGAALLGALLVVLADAAARTWVAPAELPIGVLTAGLGAPFFLALLLRRRLQGL